MRRLAVLLLLVVLSSSALALDVSLSVVPQPLMPGSAGHVTGGVPFARGVLTDAARVRLLAGGVEMPMQGLVTARWPDGSVRWLLVDAFIDRNDAIVLQTGTAAAPVAGIAITDAPATLTVDTRVARFTFTKSELAVSGLPFEVLSNAVLYRAVPSSWTIEQEGAVKSVVRIEGAFQSGAARLGSDLVGFRARLTFRRDSPVVGVALTFRNGGGFNWSGERTRAADVVLTTVRFGSAVLSGNFVFGPGVEKTWRYRTTSSGTVSAAEVRFNARGLITGSSVDPDPLLAATPSYYASTRAWGAVALPIANGGALQPELDRFEKIQRAKVAQGDLENPPGTTGITLWEHLAQDLESWNDYGDLRWDGNGCGTLSGNHYDWSYGMYLQFLRTGWMPFLNAARVFADHEIDFDVYHSADDGAAYVYQKNWEDRPSHDSPDNCFGGGRPTHTWTQGYALHWLITGEPRGRDAFRELQEGIRQYLYYSFVDDGHVNTNEIRTQGWIVDNLVALWRIDPGATLDTPAGPKTIPQVIRDVLQNVFEREAAAGANGFVYASPAGADENGWDANLRAPLQNAYFVEPAIKAYDEVFRSTDPAYAAQLLGLIRRMTSFLVSITYGGDTNGAGQYRPLQIPYFFDAREPVASQGQGQLPYLLMAANAAGFLYSETKETGFREYAERAFRDYVRHVGAIPGDTYGDPASRTPASYNSTVFTGTESKIHGWSSRYGQYFLASETSGSETVTPRRRSVRH